MRPSHELLDQIYQRLLAHEPDAPSDLIMAILEPLINVLRLKFPSIPDPNLVTDVVTDSLLNFVQQPEQYQPERGGLWNYLYMDALGDLRNAWDKERRRRIPEVPFDLVAHDRPDRNSEVEEQIIRRLVPLDLPDGLSIEEVISQLRADFSDSRDWKFIILMFSGERRTAAFAEILGITNLPQAEQRKQVKQAKDRFRLRLKRRGVKIHDR